MTIARVMALGGRVAREGMWVGSVDTRQTPLAQLVIWCREETEKFLRHEPSRDRFCLEIFRRAICDRDESAWAAVFAQYQGMVRAWVRRHPASASLHEEDIYWVNRTFDRFWTAVGPERFDAFLGMAAVLRYLKLCGHSVLLDEVRARGPGRADPLDDRVAESLAMPDVADTAVGHLAGSDLWDAIAAEAQDEAERRAAYLCFVLDLKPREVQERHPELYATVDDVYRIKRNLLDRLRRNPRIRAFLA